MKRLRFAVAVLCCAPVLQAQTTQYATRSPFAATLGTTVFDDYQNAGYTGVMTTAAVNAVRNETKYLPTLHLNSNFLFDTYCAGCNGSYQLNFATTSVSGANGVFGVGLDYWNTGGPSYVAFVTFGDNSTQNFSLNTIPFAERNFFGLTSTLLIKTIDFGLANGVTSGGGSFGQDNLLIGNALPVVGVPTIAPEPSSLALVGFGIAGLMFARRRTSKVAP